MVGGLAHGVLVAGGTAIPPTDLLKGVLLHPSLMGQQKHHTIKNLCWQGRRP